MSTSTIRNQLGDDPITRRRVGIVSLALTVTSLTAVPGGLLWPEPAGGGETYTYADIQPLRDRWWGLLVFLGAGLVLNVPAQALATALLVRRRGAAWATTGGVLMWVGTALYAVGVGGWAAASYFATAPGVDAAAGASVMDRMAEDSAHLFGPAITGALLVAIGTLVQTVGLWRSHAVPRWIPLGAATIAFTFLVPGNGVIGLVTALPMTAAALGIAYYAWRAVR
jgi:hypothetical protein